jgi:hypothetical protein
LIIECDAVSKDEPLRQGDIFKFLRKTNLWEMFGIIITTDCDIAKGKNSDVYSYCPIIDLSNYFYKVFIPKQIRIELILEKIKNILDKNTKNKGAHGVDINSIYPWIIERGIKNALYDIDSNSEEMKNAISFIFDFSNEENSISLYFRYKSILNNNFDRDKEIKKTEEQFKNYIINLPGDLFYINYIHGINEFGYIVNLRRIGMFCRENISISSNDNDEKIYLKRIARMVSPFNYRLTQKVAQMFSDIGLPEDYELDRNHTVEIFFSNLREKML